MKILALRRADSCGSCGGAVVASERAGWDRVSGMVTCLSCLDSSTTADNPKPASPVPTLERGSAGRSVTREAQRRSERHHNQQELRVTADREWRSQVKADHPLTGRLAAAATLKVRPQPAPQHIRAWVTGAAGERKVGEALEAIPEIVVLHDRRMPRSRRNIDHIAVTPAGVWVIDTKVRPDKRLEGRTTGGLFSRDERLIVGGRDETKLVNDITWQVQAVHEACADLLGDTTIRSALCFVDARVGRLDRRPGTVKGVVVCWRAVLPELLLRPGSLDVQHMTAIAERIAHQLAPA